MAEALIEAISKTVLYAGTTLSQWMLSLGTGNWLVAQASITAPPVKAAATLDCPKVEIVYSYRIEGELYTGMHVEPFLAASAATSYAERFSTGRSLIVRVKPGNPEKSVVRERDQDIATQAH